MARTASSTKKVKTTTVKRSIKAVSHPPVKLLVVGAIKALKERKGSSLLAIKKYIKLDGKLDADKLSPYIKKFLKKAVVNGSLVQTKGKGAAGSFKLPAKENKGKKVQTQKSHAAKTPKKTPLNKVKSPKKKPAKQTVKPKQKSNKPKTVVLKKPKTHKPKKAVVAKRK